MAFTEVNMIVSRKKTEMEKLLRFFAFKCGFGSLASVAKNIEVLWYLFRCWLYSGHSLGTESSEFVFWLFNWRCVWFYLSTVVSMTIYVHSHTECDLDLILTSFWPFSMLCIIILIHTWTYYSHDHCSAFPYWMWPWPD